LRYNTRIFTVTADGTGAGSVVIDSSNFGGQSFADARRNAQVTIEGLVPATARWAVEMRAPHGSAWVLHQDNATSADLILLAGPNAPLFESLRVSVSSVTAGAVLQVILTAWEREF